MESPVLFHDPTSEPSRAAHWLALELGIPVRIRFTWLMRGEHLTPELLAVNPRHQVPALRHGNLRLSEATAIMRYLAELAGGLEPWFGRTVAERANVELRLSWHHTHTRQITLKYTVPMVLMPAYHGSKQPGASTMDECRQALREPIAQLAGFLDASQYVALERITAADVFIASDLFELDADPDRGAMLDAHPRIEAWLDRLRERPAFVESCQAWTKLASEIQRRLKRKPEPGDAGWVAGFCKQFVDPPT